MSELYLLDWTETPYGQQPTASQVALYLTKRGIKVKSLPKVYRNGTVQLEADSDPTAAWAEFTPEPVAYEDKLGLYVQSLLTARAELLAIPEHKRSAVESALLATMALVMFGYGIEDA